MSIQSSLNFEQARVSGVMTNAPLMLNVDCDMYANDPQVFLHAMCIVFGCKNDQESGFVQFPQAFYDGLKDDPFGNQLAHYYVRILSYHKLLFLILFVEYMYKDLTSN